MQTLGGSGTTESSLRTIHRTLLRDTVVQSIRQAIERRELNAGETITELGLAKRLGVAQPTIREALLELEFSGFVERLGPRKTRVSVLTRDMIEDIYLVRSRLEILAVELITRKGSPDLSACFAEQQKMHSAAERMDISEFYLSDLNFHRALWRCSANQSLESSLERLIPKLFAFGVIQRPNRGREELIELASLHLKLLEFLTAGEGLAACELMGLAMERARQEDSLLPDM